MNNMYLKPDGTLVIDGKEYVGGKNKMKKIDGIEHVDKIYLREVDTVKLDKKVEFILEKIKATVSKEELLRQLLKKVPLNELDKTYKSLKKKGKKKVSSQKGCLGFKVGTGKFKTGGSYLQLIE